MSADSHCLCFTEYTLFSLNTQVVFQAKKENVGGDMKGDGFQNGGTLVVGEGELSDLYFSSVSTEERSGQVIECQTLNAEVLGWIHAAILNREKWKMVNWEVNCTKNKQNNFARMNNSMS